MGKLKVRISLPRNEQSYGKKMMFDEAVRFYAKEIMGSRLANLCTIKVHFRKYVSKRKDGRLELKIKLHLAVKDAWEPYEDYLNTLSKEELIELAKKTILVDHVNDNPLDNSLENLNYSDPWNNSNHRKNWVDKG